MAVDKRNKRRGGFYWVDGIPYISVTNVLRVIDKPALSYWFGKKVYWAFVNDPSLSEKDALRAPYSASGEAKERGNTVHSIIETYKQTGKRIESVPAKFKPYVQAFYNWIDDNDVEIIENERTVISKEHGYGGTGDLIVRLNKTEDIWMIDAKTGKDIYDEVELQLSAYKKGSDEAGLEINRLGVLLLETGKDEKPTGNYKFAEKTYNIEAFLAAKKLWEWKNQSKIEAVEYNKYHRSQ